MEPTIVNWGYMEDIGKMQTTTVYLGFRAYVLRFGDESLGLRVYGLGFIRVWGLGLRVYGLGFMV